MARKTCALARALDLPPRGIYFITNTTPVLGNAIQVDPARLDPARAQTYEVLLLEGREHLVAQCRQLWRPSASCEHVRREAPVDAEAELEARLVQAGERRRG